LFDGNLRAGWRGDQDSPQFVHVVAEVAAVPDVDGITLAPSLFSATISPPIPEVTACCTSETVSP
jgi:hypothetical protein